MGGGPSPFGMDPADAVACARRPARRIDVRGVHAHLASGLDAGRSPRPSPPPWSTGRLAEVDAAEVDIGGGMAVDYTRPGGALRLGGLRPGPGEPSAGTRACGCGSSRAGR